MQSLEEKKAYTSVISKTCYLTDIIYLILHLLYLVFFIISKAYILIYLDCVSIVLYPLFLLVIKKKKYYAYALFCGNEFLIFMSAATILCGMSSGFYLNIIGLSVVAFFTSYFSKDKGIKEAIFWAVLSAIICLILLIYSYFNDPYYTLYRWEIVTLMGIHILTAFAFIVSYLLIFLIYVMKLEKRIINESRTDELTKLHNRYDLYNYLDSINNKNDYVLGIFDIDDFKHANDKYGHVCGDLILKELADISKRVLFDSFVSRYGGEEFVIIIKSYGNVNIVYNKIEDLRKEIENHEFKFEDNIIHITITTGLEKYESGMNIEDWISKADEKLYLGKNSGKNKTVL